MKIAAILPTFNRAKTLPSAINSILEQSYPVHEILTIDDGSTDETQGILKEYSVHIRTFFQANSGVSAARNLGIREARSEWIAFIDSDDSWKREKLEKQVLIHKQNPKLLISHTEEQWIRNKKPVVVPKRYTKREGHLFKHALDHCALGPSTVLMHVSLFERFGLFDESFPACEDFDLWLRILRDIPVGLVKDPLTIKTGGHSDQLSTTVPMLDIYRIKALEKHLDPHPHLKKVLETLCHKCRIVSEGAFKHNNHDLYAIYHSKYAHYFQWLERLEQ